MQNPTQNPSYPVKNNLRNPNRNPTTGLCNSWYATLNLKHDEKLNDSAFSPARTRHNGLCTVILWAYFLFATQNRNMRIDVANDNPNGGRGEFRGGGGDRVVQRAGVPYRVDSRVDSLDFWLW